MADSTKPLSTRDANQTLQSAFNDVNHTLGVDGFIVGKVGRRIDVTAGTTDDTFDFSESGNALYTIVVTYTDATKETLLSVERTA